MAREGPAWKGQVSPGFFILAQEHSAISYHLSFSCNSDAKIFSDASDTGSYKNSPELLVTYTNIVYLDSRGFIELADINTVHHGCTILEEIETMNFIAMNHLVSSAVQHINNLITCQSCGKGGIEIWILWIEEFVIPQTTCEICLQ